MVYKIKVCTSSCPYCGATISKEYYGPDVWGPKFGRCPSCKNVFRTGKKLYSDISQAERDKDRKEFIQAISITIPLFFISLLVTIFTGWELVGLLSFFFFMGTLIFVVSHFQKRKIVLSKYAYLKKSDPELYQLEYNETVKLLGHQSIEEIEYNIKSAIEHKILKYLGCLALSILASELVLMILLGDSIEGVTAILLLFAVAVPISFLFYYLFVLRKKSTNQSYSNDSIAKIYNTTNSSTDKVPNFSTNRTAQNNVSQHGDSSCANKPTHICLSDANDSPKRIPGGIYSEDISIQPQTSTPPPKSTFPTQVIADGLAELCIKELVEVIGICDKHHVTYDERKLIISTFCYFYVIWIFNFENITAGQARDVEKIYKNHFCNFNRKKFEDLPFKTVLENEEIFSEQLRRIDRRIRASYHSNNHTFIDDGLTDEYILEFIDCIDDKEKIKPEIVHKVLKEWAYVANKAGKQTSVSN